MKVPGLANFGDAGQVTLDVGCEYGNTGAGKTLRHDLQRHRLAGSGRPGDESVPLASASVSHAVSSPLPMKIFSSVSAVLLSEVAITSPLRAHRGDLVGNHIASCPSIETVRGAHVKSPPTSACALLILFSDRHEKNARNAAQQVSVNPGIKSCIAATLGESKIISKRVGRLYFRSQALKINSRGKRPVSNRLLGTGQYGRTGRTAGLQGRHR